MDMKDTLLLAEDDEALRLLIASILEGEGFNLVTAVDGRDAQSILLQNPNRFSAILLDWEMPNMTGINLLRWMKEEPQFENIPVIMETVMREPEQIREGIDAGAFYYLTKPFEQQLLVSIVKAALNDFHYKESLTKRLKESENPFRGLVEGTFRFRSLEDGELLALWLANACPCPEQAIEINEILSNAVEHGNLGITYDEKSALITKGEWISEVEQRLALEKNTKKYVEVCIERSPEQLIVYVEDQGPGFDFRKYLAFDEARVFHNHGRGIAIASSSMKLEYLDKGNRVRITVPLSS
ncbi:MAG: response regulator [Ignavibacteriae bacterium]|nr:response regulator [Ignavibacteria bacterium]MBI3363324.1 response regulator [Ignavibacteriota bacterium]